MVPTDYDASASPDGENGDAGVVAATPSSFSKFDSGDELSLERKLRQKSVDERVAEYRQSGRTSAPWVIELDPTTACNLACPDCISGSLLNKGGFQRERLRALAKEFVEAGVRAVVLIGGGEPMAHPEFGWIVRYFAEEGVHIGITTNGTLIDRYLDLLAQHVKWLRVSVDAGTDKTFLRFRPAPNGQSRFRDVVRNMTALAKKKAGKLGYSFLLLTEFDRDGREVASNADDIAVAGKLAKDIGCDYFEVKPSFDMNHFLVRQPERVRNVAKEQIASLADLVDDNFRVVTPYTLHEVLADRELVQAKSYDKCSVSHLRTLVSPSGVYVCPYFRGNEAMKIGDASKESLREIWSGARRHAVMEKVVPSKTCGFHCIRHGSNLALEKKDGGSPVVEDYDFFI
jgi:MoaA/NifB/PqqE/SkfB family radical SAM enzyme